MSDTPLNVLLVKASGRANGSVSRRLAADFTTALEQTGRKMNIVERDLADGMPLIDEEWINANFTPEEERTAQQAAVLSYSDMLIDELKKADVIVIATPVYNFGTPASLKAWIDQIVRARTTFKYTEDGPVGLLQGKHTVIITATGGTEIGSPIDFSSPYLRHILGFIGLHDVSTISSDKLLSDADAALAKAKTELAAVVNEIAAA